jgi:NTP pyrophosphatase (non-canonical NTP hydrolase)
MISHDILVSALAKPGEDILKALTPLDCHLWHMSSALCGEAGELFDAIKKRVIYRKNLDFQNVIEELGDVEFYLEGIRQALSITREEVLAANVLKLTKRYKDRYSDDAAQKRADKQPPA